MSVLLPGLGQMYLGKGGRAAIWFAGLVAIYLITGQRDGDRWIAPVFATVLGIAAAIDAMVSGRGAGQRR
jgi:TM2 domain-containing membrane protein YozV